jgi:tetratricopeptide (TPR) repeat protein
MATPADRAIRTAQAQVTDHPDRDEAYLALATAYIRKVREAGDRRYYAYAETALKHVLKRQPAEAQALGLLAWIQMGKLEFAAALETAQRALAQQVDSAWIYGIIGDAYVELGDYAAASAAWQRMMDLRPGPASYSRAAHMQALMGHDAQATEIMAMAAQSMSRRDSEGFAWFLVQYGDMHFHQGHLKVAEAAYTRALEVFPRYYRALAALARVRGAQQQFEAAIRLYRQAIDIVPEPDIVAALGDMLALTGNAGQAAQQYALVEFMASLETFNAATNGRQIAHFYADHERHLARALQLAESEHKRRQDIYTCDTLAWVYFKTGRLTEAWNAMQHALRLGTQDAMLFYHAGMIAHGLGKFGTAQTYLQRALRLNPYFSPMGARIASQSLAEISEAAFPL